MRMSHSAASPWSTRADTAKEGNARLAIYRDADAPVFVADEFRSMIERAPSLVRLPDLLRYLLEYPNTRCANQLVHHRLFGESVLCLVVQPLLLPTATRGFEFMEMSLRLHQSG